MTVIRRRIIIRSILALVWIGAAVLLFVNFRGHTILVDNKGADDGSYAAVDLMKVSLDGGKGVEFFKNDRDRFTVVGSRHRLGVQFVDGRPAVEQEFTLPLGIDVFILSVPKLIAGVEPFLEPFIQVRETREDDGEARSGAFQSPEEAPLTPEAVPMPLAP